MLILAIGHEKNVGKDTLARLMVSHLRTTRRKLSVGKKAFADTLKDTCYMFYAWAGMQRKEYYEENPKAKNDVLKTGKTVREHWIEYGQHLRQLDHQIHINTVLNAQHCDIVIASDLRFPDEAHRILDRGGFVIQLKNGRIPHTSDEADDALLGFNYWTETVQNDGDLHQLNDVAIYLCEKYLNENHN